MKKAQRTDFFREIRKSLNRYLSILFIVALGVAFYAGIRSAEPDMDMSLDTCYTQAEMMDIRVLGTLGMTGEDVAAIAEIPGIASAEGSYQAEVLCQAGGTEQVLTVYAVTKGMNRPTVIEGRLPEAQNECFLDRRFANTYGFTLGDEILVSSGTEDDIADTLAETTYQVVGIGSYAWYLSLERGAASIGNGSSAGFMMIPKESFSQEAFSVVYVKADTKGAAGYTKEYEDAIEEIKEKIEAIADERCEIRYVSVTEEAQEKIADGEAEITDAEEKLADAEVKLADGEAELEDGRQKLADAEDELNDGKRELAEKEQELLDAKKELADAGQKLEDARIEIGKGEGELGRGWDELRANEDKVGEAKKELEAGKSQLEGSRKQLDAGWQEYQTGVVSLETLKASVQQLEQAKAAAAADPSGTAAAQVLAAMSAFRGQLVAATPELDYVLPGANAPGFYEAFLPAVQTAVIAPTSSRLADAKATLDAGEAEWQKGNQKIIDAEAQVLEADRQIAEGRATLEENERKLNDAKKELADGEASYQDGLAKIADGEKQLADAKKTLADGEKELADARKELEEGEEKFNDARQEYDDAKKEADEKLPDARQKIADAKEALAELEVPEWFVLGRDSIQSYVEYGMDADRIGAVGQVFPAIFFLVAALVSLTTMTRMVEEERTQIGTMKALGYGKWAIASKYILYALSASLIGSVIGIVVGSSLLPAVIMQAYGILYVNMTVQLTPIQPGLAISAIVIAVSCTVLATMAACYKELLSSPAELMRPAAPKQGKRVFLERITFLWKRLKFTEKATIRNLFRYKKRFFMTIFGIGGCMALLMVSFGLRDSIQEIVNNQYTNVFTYDASIGIDEESKKEEKDAFAEALLKEGRAEDALLIKQTAFDVEANGITKNANLFVPETLEALERFVMLKDRVTDEAYELTDDGVIITEKLASLLGVEAGDTIYIKDGDTKKYSVTVTAVSENYLFHYIYMTAPLYEQVFGEAPEYNQLFIQMEDTTEAEEEALAKELLSGDLAESVNFVRDLQATVENMMSSLDYVVWVLIIAAALLAFVVLYNLNNINITERKRELATLKVLGFYDREVSEYVYRENVFLTIFGILAGIAIGIVLHQFVIRTCEIDMLMFGREIAPLSYVYSILLTILFAMLVNVSMFYKLKKIDMIESLKSVE